MRRFIDGVRDYQSSGRSSNGVHLVSPLVLPWHSNRAIRSVNTMALKAQVARLYADHDISDPLVWSFLPGAIDYLNLFRPDKTVYHCVDELSEYPVPGIPKQYIEKAHQRMLGAADVVFFASNGLQNKYGAVCKNEHHVVPSATAFGPEDFENLIEPEEIAHVTEPIIGYVGSLHFSVDFELLDRLCWEFPQAHILCVGPFAVSGVQLPKHRNFTHIPKVPHHELPMWLRRMKVGLIPFLDNEHIRYSCPTKFFDYMAAGLPVVSTDVPELRRFDRTIAISPDHDGFVRNVEYLLEGLAPGFADSARMVASQNTWSARVQQVSTILGL
jgi:glycosyltransferase involved in cell wall biosynthesis